MLTLESRRPHCESVLWRVLPSHQDSLRRIEVYVEDLLALVDSIRRFSVASPVIHCPNDFLNPYALHLRPSERGIMPRHSGTITCYQELTTGWMNDNGLAILLPP